MSVKLTKSQLSLLAAISLATASETGFQYAQPEHKDVKALAAANYIEHNTSAVNPEDETEVATRATAAGIEASGAAPTETAPKTAPAPKQSFAVVTGIEIPPAARGGRKSSEQYPFGTMEVGASFFVPASEQTPDPKKSLSSTVNTANSRYSEEIPGQTKVNRKGVEVPATRQLREFALREVNDGAPWGEQYAGLSGAAVWRTA